MIGSLAGLGLLFSYLGAAWSKEALDGSLFSSGWAGAFVTLGIFTIVGIFLFPRTVGIAFTPMSFATPICFFIALFKHGLGYSLFILAIGVGAWFVTFVLGILRSDAT